MRVINKKKQHLLILNVAASTVSTNDNRMVTISIDVRSSSVA